MNFLEEIKLYEPQNEKEQKDKSVMMQYIVMYYDKIAYRSNMLFHMTASAIVCNENKDKILMIYHKIYQSWSWLGGHADGEYDLQKTAIKEVQEETGVSELKAIKNGIVSLDILTVEGHYKNKEYVCPHIHLNVTYCFIASEKSNLIQNEQETEGVKWIPISEIPQYCTEPKMLPIYQKIIQRIKK